jgi:PIN domain nuclease of toxin-antitoxin system
VNLLLDTNLLIRSAQGDLPHEAANLIADLNNNLHYSVAALWEISIKHGSGKLQLPVTPWELELGLTANGYQSLDIKSKHVRQLSSLAQIHRDPFDRIMVAQAITEQMLLLTLDQTLAKYGQAVKVIH